jgi:hypothetical protein
MERSMPPSTWWTEPVTYDDRGRAEEHHEVGEFLDGAEALDRRVLVGDFCRQASQPSPESCLADLIQSG